MISIKKTDGNDADFRSLIALLDADLYARYGEIQKNYDKFNKVDFIKQVLVISEDEKPLACGAIKPFDDQSYEIKRVFTHPDGRGKGLATKIMSGLETWATELGARRVVLETGDRQDEAIKLYRKLGYSVIPNYTEYVGMEHSICFEKLLV